MASGGQNLSGYDPQIQQICHWENKKAGGGTTGI
jgi:hypothetical protein